MYCTPFTLALQYVFTDSECRVCLKLASRVLETPVKPFWENSIQTLLCSLDWKKAFEWKVLMVDNKYTINPMFTIHVNYLNLKELWNKF